MTTRTGRACETGGRQAGFTLLELLTVVTIIGILAIVAVPLLLDTRPKAARKEGMTNIMRIASGLETYRSDGNFGYSTGSGGTCPGNATYGANATLSDFNIAVSGALFQYNVAVADPNGDNLCESYTVTATGVGGSSAAGITLSLDNLGVKNGPWQ